MDQDKDKDNRTKQCDPTHVPTGPGHNAGYQGDKEKATMDNKAGQQDPNNPKHGK